VPGVRDDGTDGQRVESPVSGRRTAGVPEKHPDSEDAARIEEVEQMVGKLIMQLEIAKKASRLLDGMPNRNCKRR